MVVINEQLTNACSPIVVTLFGIVMAFKEVQSKKAVLPILVTPLGMVMLVSPKHL